MEIELSQAMLASINEHILKIRGAQSILEVYNTAEVIRLKHINENVAREDIIEELVRRGGLNARLNLIPENELDDTLEVIDGPEIEMLMPLDNLKFVN